MSLSKGKVMIIAKYNILKPYYYTYTWLDLASFFGNRPELYHDQDVNKVFEFTTNSTESDKQLASDNLLVIKDFLSLTEEQSLLNEIEPSMKRLRYQYDHWDKVIHGFRETERLKWNESNSRILNRIKHTAFVDSLTLPSTHILDLAENGFIKPHIDSIRFCGNIIAGMSLLSDSVMRFCNEKTKFSFSVLLERRSLYVMRGPVRYEFTHEILPSDLCFFQGIKVVRKRRISVICRSQPESVKEENTE